MSYFLLVTDTELNHLIPLNTKSYQKEISLHCFSMGGRFGTSFLGLHPLLTCTVHPANAWSLQMGHHWKGKWTRFPIIPNSMLTIRWQQWYDQPNTNFFQTLQKVFSNLSHGAFRYNTVLLEQLVPGSFCCTFCDNLNLLWWNFFFLFCSFNNCG